MIKMKGAIIKQMLPSLGINVNKSPACLFVDIDFAF